MAAILPISRGGIAFALAVSAVLGSPPALAQGRFVVELGAGASYSPPDSVLAPQLALRAGISTAVMDYSVATQATLGGNSSFNPDCCASRSSYRSLTLLLEIGTRPAFLATRLYAGAGISSITLLAKEAAHLAGSSDSAPTALLGIAPELWSFSRVVLSMDFQAILWTGVGTTGTVDRFGHDSWSYGVNVLVAAHFNP